MIVKVTGLRDLERRLLRLGSAEATKVLRAAMFKAARPIADQAEANARAIAHSGALAESIGMRFRIGKKGGFGFGALLPSLGGRFSVIIAPIRKARAPIALYNLVYKRKRPRRGIIHGHFLEFGTKRSRKRPFLRPALDARGAQAVQAFRDALRAGITRLFKK